MKVPSWQRMVAPAGGVSSSAGDSVVAATARRAGRGGDTTCPTGAAGASRV
jgi:hypothetical protein